MVHSPCFDMKLNIACPETGAQKSIDIDDDKKLLPFFDKRVSQEVSGDALGDEFRGYRFRITGGNDKQGFPMMQGVLCPDRVRLLLRKGSKCYRQRRTGEMKRKSVRGCIVSQELSVLNLLIVRKGEAEIPGVTDEEKPVRLGPKLPPRSASSSPSPTRTTCASSWSVGPSPPRPARSTRRPPRSSAWSPPASCSASVTVWPSIVAAPRRTRRSRLPTWPWSLSVPRRPRSVATSFS